MTPPTRYARNGDVSIAYSVSGDGPIDVLFSSGLISHVEHLWEEPGVRRFLERLGSFGRLILVDRRGSGLSDRTQPGGALDDELGDLDAVLDAVGSERVALIGYTSGGPLTMTYAAERPDRVSHLVLYAAIARTTSGPGYEFAHSAEERFEAFERQLAAWGSGALIELAAPSRADDPALREWFARLERLSASPGAMRTNVANAAQVDVRHVLPRITVPTLVLHRTGDQLIDPGHSRYVAAHVPGARLVEMPGDDQLISAGDADTLLEEIEEFLTGGRAAGARQRALRTVLFTDVVDATAQASALGDAAWRGRLASHDAVIRRLVGVHDGVTIKTTGDGILATFAGPPSGAVRCAAAIARDVEALGIGVRVGLHTGECELVENDVAGMAVHIAARVCAQAQAGEVLVSGTVFGTVVGSGLVFEHRGERALKGVPERWPLFALTGPGR